MVRQQSFGGNAVTLKGIAFFDVGNGIFLLIYFLESAQGIFMKGLMSCIVYTYLIGLYLIGIFLTGLFLTGLSDKNRNNFEPF